MSKVKIVVVGGNFAGLTCALDLRHKLGDEAQIAVVSASDHFVFNPSLIWLPFGKRNAADITFPLAETFQSHGVDFYYGEATSVDQKAKTVTTTVGNLSYDYLVLASGYRNDFAVVDGLGPDGNAYTITTLQDAEQAAKGWQKFLEEPGDVLVGATQGASCFGAAYEFLFNLTYQLRKLGLRRKVKVSFVTPEPFLGHFGMGGLAYGEKLIETFMRKEGVDAYANVGFDVIDEKRAILTDGRAIDFSYAMIVPPFVGQPLAKSVPRLADKRGFVEVRETYQARAYDDIYAIGVAAAVPVPWQSAFAVGIPKTGFPTERMAHIAASNIAAQIRGEAPQAEQAFGDIPAVCVMDAGNNGVVILSDKMLPPRKFGVLVPGPQAHAMKVAFEKYYLWKARHGYVNLP